MTRQKTASVSQRSQSSLVGHRTWRPVQRRVRVPQPVAEVPSQRQVEIEHELLLARDIQQGLLLEAVPQLTGWEISAMSLPARDLGGDLYDFLRLDAGVHGIMIGDVSGKGLPAALRMAVARTVFRHEARKGCGPAATLGAINRGILADIPQGMVTMLYVALETHSGVLRMANAGHTYPVVINGMVSEIELNGLPLGVDGDSTYSEWAIQLGHGDTVFLCTDGVAEATNPAGEMYGDWRLQRLLLASAGLRPRVLVTELLHELRAWSGGGQTDDITLVVVRRRCMLVGTELRLVAEDVLGSERAALLWQTDVMPSADASATAWAEALPAIIGWVQTQFGRGLGRELNAQMRLVLEDYK